MAIVRIDSTRITDWASFHHFCKEAFGFPDFYGKNFDAFIDCLTYIDEGDGMSDIVLAENESLTIEVTRSASFKNRFPEIDEFLTDAVRVINERFIEEGKQPRVDLIWIP